jgi:hypothetical protein
VEHQFVLVESAEQDGTEVERPHAVVDFLEADILLDDAGADVDPTFLPADAAVATDAPGLEYGKPCGGGDRPRNQLRDFGGKALIHA